MFKVLVVLFAFCGAIELKVRQDQGPPSCPPVSLQVIPGGDGTAFNGQWSAQYGGNKPASNAFDGDLNTEWDAGSGGNAESGWNVENWVIFQAQNGPVTVSQLSFATEGDTTHDVKGAVLQGSTSSSGPWSPITTVNNAQLGTSKLQSFPASSSTAYSYFRWSSPVNMRPTQYQCWVREIQLLGCPPAPPAPAPGPYSPYSPPAPYTPYSPPAYSPYSPPAPYGYTPKCPKAAALAQLKAKLLKKKQQKK